jgi:hypothetical protein
MSPECHFFRILDGRIVSIRPNDRDTSWWELWLGETLIGDSFTSEDEAAFHAHRHDFPNDRQKRLFDGVWVPDHLDSWSFGKLPGELARTEPMPERTSTCPKRPWERGRSVRLG